MDKSTIHDLALTSAKYWIDANLTEYKVLGYEKLTEDLLNKYQAAYKQIHTIANSSKDWLD